MDVAILEKSLREINDFLGNGENIPSGFFEHTNDEYLCSAQNLLHYLQLRNIDIRSEEPDHGHLRGGTYTCRPGDPSPGKHGQKGVGLKGRNIGCSFERTGRMLHVEQGPVYHGYGIDT
ncbi:MAG: hypothetical protein WBG90_12785 [Saonia sp.]